MLKSDIIETIAADIDRHIGGEWKHEVDLYGYSAKHLNFNIDGKDYVLVLYEVEDGHCWVEYVDGERKDDSRFAPNSAYNTHNVFCADERKDGEK